MCSGITIKLKVQVSSLGQMIFRVCRVTLYINLGIQVALQGDLMWFSTCRCSVVGVFQKEYEKIHLPSFARLVFQFPGSPSCPAASAPVINVPCLLKGTSQRQRGRRMLLGLKSTEGVCRGWVGHLQMLTRLLWPTPALQ